MNLQEEDTIDSSICQPPCILRFAEPQMTLLSITSLPTIQLCSNFPTRSSDIFTCSYPKSGTTWMPHIIISLLILAGKQKVVKKEVQKQERQELCCCDEKNHEVHGKSTSNYDIDDGNNNREQERQSESTRANDWENLCHQCI
ncbi:MAG: sulfotransferase domain-containing protein [Gloeomargaritales cyanobacterium]